MQNKSQAPSGFISKPLGKHKRMGKIIPILFFVALGLLAFNAAVEAQLDDILELQLPEPVKIQIEPEPDMMEYVL